MSSCVEEEASRGLEATRWSTSRPPIVGASLAAGVVGFPAMASCTIIVSISGFMNLVGRICPY